MRYLKLSVIMLLAVMLATPCFAQITPNGVPLLIEYNGHLSKLNGSPYPTGIYDINFKICDDAGCINVLWSETHTVEISNRDKKDINGGTSYEAAFSIVLGSINTLDLLFDQDYYLHISESTGGYDKIEQLLSATYCLRGEFANYADTAYDSNDDTYKDVKAIKVANAFQADNSDTVDNIHAYWSIGDIPAGEDGLVAYAAISTEVNTRISNHAEETTAVHGVTGNIVGTTDTQTLANKTVTDSTITDSTITNSQIQKRVTGTCAPGSSIRVVNSDGSVICEPDTDTQLSKSTVQAWADEVDDVGVTWNDLCSVPEFQNLLGAPVQVQYLGYAGHQCQSEEAAACISMGGNYTYGAVWGGGGPGVINVGGCDCLFVTIPQANSCGISWTVGNRVESLYNVLY